MNNKHSNEICRCNKYNNDSKKCIDNKCWYYFPLKKCGVNYIMLTKDDKKQLKKHSKRFKKSKRSKHPKRFKKSKHSKRSKHPKRSKKSRHSKR